MSDERQPAVAEDLAPWALVIDRLAALGTIGPLPLALGRTVGRLTGSSPRAAAAALASHAVDQGHVCVDLQRICLLDAELDAAVGGGDALLATLAALGVGPLDEARPSPLVLDGAGRLYLYRYALYQRKLARAVLDRLGHVDHVDAAALRAGLQRLFPLSQPRTEPDRQALAAEACVMRRFTIVTGGPGTGKTSTVTKVLVLLAEQAAALGEPSPRMALVAPTGKAAQRASEAVARGLAELDCHPDVREVARVEASTIHRLLGYQARTPSRFRFGADRPLPVDLVVCDETSMVDLGLLVKLVEAVPRGARLVLLGDRHQLASVDAGAVFGDLCAAAAVADDIPSPTGISRPLNEPGRSPAPLRGHMVELRHSHRFDDESALGRLGRAIRAGDADDALSLLHAPFSLAPTDPAAIVASALGSEESVVVHVEAKGAALERALDAYASHFAASCLGERAADARLSRIGGLRLLAAHRGGRAGVGWLNAGVERRLAALGAIAPRGRLHYEGRPILVTENDYRVGLWNGEVGLEAHRGGRLEALFGATAGTRGLPLSRLPSHETAYAMTVHRSQGSEFERVLLVLPEEPSPLCTRELVYTAATRARRVLCVVGPAEVFRQALAVRVARMSGLGDELAGAR